MKTEALNPERTEMKVKTATPAEELVDDLIHTARAVEWEAHFGHRWDFVRQEMLEARAKVLAALTGAEG